MNRLYYEDGDYICKCPKCDHECKESEMCRSYDCHGIPYRLVCANCYEQILNGNGYDGEYYDEWEENLDEDY